MVSCAVEKSSNIPNKSKDMDTSDSVLVLQIAKTKLQRSNSSTFLYQICSTKLKYCYWSEKCIKKPHIKTCNLNYILHSKKDGSPSCYNPRPPSLSPSPLSHLLFSGSTLGIQREYKSWKLVGFGEGNRIFSVWFSTLDP